MAQRSTGCNRVCQAPGVMFLTRDGGRGSAAAAYQPMYWPPFADRFAPVIQLASSGMKKATA